MSDATVAVIYDSVEGQTEEIARYMAKRIEGSGPKASVFGSGSAPADLAPYSGVVAGGSVHVGKHGKRLVEFVKAHRAELESRPSAFFSVSLSAAGPDERHQADAARMVDVFKRETEWEPEQVGLLAGAVKYSKYNFVKRWIMRRIVAKESGDTDTSRDYVYTDWAAVDAFVDAFVARLAARS